MSLTNRLLFQKCYSNIIFTISSLTPSPIVHVLKNEWPRITKKVIVSYASYYFQVEQQLMEEFLIETCVEQMLRDDDDEESIPPDLHVALNAEMMRGVSSNAISPVSA